MLPLFVVIPLAAIIIVAFLALGANITAWAWNIVVFDLFKGPGPIDGWQGLAVNFLIGLATSGFRKLNSRDDGD